MKRFVCTIVALLATLSSASAQDFRGGITGRITDASGGRMPGVTVTATNVATNVASTTTTNGEGDYAILFLNPGTYSLAAELSGFRKGVRNPPQPSFGDGDVGEWPGTLAGAYQMADGVAPYRVQRLAAGLIAMTVSGLVAGLAGTSGGFVKTPAASELMHVPVKVAASTTTFTIGVTSAAD